MSEEILYVTSRPHGHHYQIYDDNGYVGDRYNVEETTTTWDKTGKQVRRRVSTYALDDIDGSGPPPPVSWRTYPATVLPSYTDYDNYIVDSYVVPAAPGAGYVAGRVGERCFVFHTGTGHVAFFYCALHISQLQLSAPGLDVPNGQVVLDVTGGHEPLPNVSYSTVEVEVDGQHQRTYPTTYPKNGATQSDVPLSVELMPGNHTVVAWEVKQPFCRTQLTFVVPDRPALTFQARATGPSSTQTTGTISVDIIDGYRPVQLEYKPTGAANWISGTLSAYGQPNYRRWTSPALSPGEYDIRVKDTNPDPGSSTIPPFTTQLRAVTIPAAPPQTCHLAFESIKVLAPPLGEQFGEIQALVRNINSTDNQQHRVSITLLPERGQPVVRTNLVNYYAFTGLAPGKYHVTARDESDTGCYATSAEIIIPEPPPSHYSFLPWVKQRLAQNATTVAGSLRPTIPMKVNLQVTTGSTTSLVQSPMDLEINGPGDITGFQFEAVLKTTPVADEQRFSPLELAAIEFKDEDLPWRYSPVSVGSSNQATPWCFLLTLEETEYQLQDQNNRPLPVVRIQNGPLFPTAAQMWPWAHVQVNKNLAAASSTTPAAATVATAEQFLNFELPLNPSLAFSRVLSARRLKPNTRYQAFLLPSFETGRLAGLGQPVAASSASALAWDGKAANADLDFPVYYQWAFQTGAEENFEALARLLQPTTLPVKPAKLAVVLPLHSASTPASGLLQARQAIVAPNPLPQSPSPGAVVLAMPAVVEPWGTPSTRPPAAVVNELYAELSLGFAPPAASTRNRPAVTPPVYGRYYTASDQLTNPNGSIPANWKYEVNLDPRYRVIASLGSQAVQEKQEEYMQRAWAQVKDLMAVNHNLRSLQLSLQATTGLRNKHLPVIAAAASFAVARPSAVAAASRTAAKSAIATAAPTEEDEPAVVTLSSMENYGLQLTALGQARTRAADSGLTVRESIRRSDIPQAVFTPAFRRIMRPFGRYQLGQAGPPLRPSQDEPAAVAANLLDAPTSLRQRDLLISLLQAKELQAADPKPDTARIYQFEDRVLDALTKNAEAPAALHVKLPEQEYQVINDGPALAAFTNAYADFRESLTYLTPVEIKSPLPLDTVKEQVAVATFPDAVLTARVKETVKQTTHNEPGDFMLDDFYAGDFLLDEESIVAALADTGDSSTQGSSTGPAGFAARSVAPAPSLVGGGAGNSGPVAVAPATNVLKPVMAYPVFRDAMGDILRKTHPELFLPNLADFPANSVALLQINRKVIEAYMLGVNHAFGSELLWREFPTDLRGSYFQQFWDASEYVNLTPPGNRTPKQIEEDNLDIRPLDQWASRSLGANAQLQAPAPGTILAIRAELLRRFPNTVVCLKAAKPVLGAPGQWQPDDTRTSYPIGRIALGQDVLALTFAVTHAELTNTTSGGYFVVFMERPGEPQFGLDELVPPPLANAVVPAPASWNDLSWDYMGTVRGSNLAVAPTAKPQVTAGAVRHVADSAQLAYALLREPVMVAIPAQSLIRIPSTNAPTI